MFGCKAISLCVVLGVLVSATQGKVFNRCQLVRELRRQGFPAGQLRNWVCLVESESGRDTSRVGPRNQNGSRDYGLFQINDKYWCNASSKPGKDCHATCSDFTKDDITKASQCAKKIFARHGFRAWYGWRAKCQGALPDISSC